jgi:hypothetical protein
LTLPAIKALRLRYPDASLRVAGYPSLWDVAGSLVDEVVSIDAAMFAGLFTGSPSDRFCDWLHKVDLVVAWTVRDACPALEACGVPHAVHASPYPPPGVHASDWLVGSMREELGPILGSAASTARQTGRVPTISLTPEEMGHGREVLAAMGLERSVAIHPGAGAPWKRWPAERFGVLAQELVRLGHQVVLIEGPADEEVVTEIQQQLAAEIPVFRRQPLRVLAAMLAHCALFVGNDSGVTHLAAAAGAPVPGPRGEAVQRLFRCCATVIARQTGRNRYGCVMIRTV